MSGYSILSMLQQRMREALANRKPFPKERGCSSKAFNKAKGSNTRVPGDNAK